MRKRLYQPVLACCSIVLLAVGCNQRSAEMRAADEESLRKADIAWSKTAENKQVDELVAYFLDDAVLLPSNEPMTTGKEDIRKMVSGMFSLPGFAFKWQPTKVDVSSSGDLAYTLGTYESSIDGPDGKPMMDRGKYATVWKKQPDGSWKVAVDMFNSDMPMPQP